MYWSRGEVQWADTGEAVTKFRRRAWSSTPGFLRAWVYGLGFLIGAPLGPIAAAIVASLNTSAKEIILAGVVGSLLGGGVCYAIGLLYVIFGYGNHYRRMR